jgi:hypothetical protein
MKKLVFVAALICIAAGLCNAQLLKRTTTKTDSIPFGAGSTLAITGAPTGSIRVTGSNTREVKITAEIEIQASSEADLAKLAEVTGFITTESASRTGIVSIGTHNKAGDKKLWNKFPKALMNLPARIDYTIEVPRYCDLEIDGGKGDLAISGVEGSVRVNFLETKARIDMLSGSLNATFGSGTADIVLGVKGWRGRSADVQMAKGDLIVEFPANTAADLDATILRTGSIDNKIPDLKPRDRKVAFTDRSILTKVGVGGPAVKVSVGDGHLVIAPIPRP